MKVLMLDDILLNLKVLSLVEKGGRIYRDSNGQVRIDTDKPLQAITRYLRGNSRNQAVDDVRSVINKACDKATDIMNSTQMNIYDLKEVPGDSEKDDHQKKVEELLSLIRDMGLAIKGIENLKQTYCEDAIVVSQFDIIISNCDAKIREMKLKLENYHHRFIKGNSKAKNETSLLN